MSLVVTALSQDGDTAALKGALEAAGLSRAALQVIGPEEPSLGLRRGLADTALLTSDPGTAVPGINIGSRTSLRAAHSTTDRLADLDIPESQLDDYAEALHRGKSVIAYFAKPDTVDRVEAVFRGDGSLTNVRRFRAAT